jgi:hypothetical protein
MLALNEGVWRDGTTDLTLKEANSRYKHRVSEILRIPKDKVGN